MKIMCKKLRSKSGFSLSELLITTLILGIMTTALTAGITASLRVYNQSVTYSEERMLLSTLSEAVMDELRYAKEAKVQGTELKTFTSETYGRGVSFTSGADGIVKLKDSNLVGEGVYSNGRLCAKLVKGNITDSDTAKNAEAGITYDSSTKSYKTTLKVWVKDSAQGESNAELKPINVKPFEEPEIETTTN